MIDVELEKLMQDIRDGKFHTMVLQLEKDQLEKGHKPKPKSTNRIQKIWKKITSSFYKLKN
jgi:hypothetical protein